MQLFSQLCLNTKFNVLLLRLHVSPCERIDTIIYTSTHQEEAAMDEQFVVYHYVDINSILLVIIYQQLLLQKAFPCVHACTPVHGRHCALFVTSYAPFWHKRTPNAERIQRPVKHQDIAA